MSFCCIKPFIPHQLSPSINLWSINPSIPITGRVRELGNKITRSEKVGRLDKIVSVDWWILHGNLSGGLHCTNFESSGKLYTFVHTILHTYKYIYIICIIYIVFSCFLIHIDHQCLTCFEPEHLAPKLTTCLENPHQAEWWASVASPGVPNPESEWNVHEICEKVEFWKGFSRIAFSTSWHPRPSFKALIPFGFYELVVFIWQLLSSSWSVANLSSSFLKVYWCPQPRLQPFSRMNQPEVSPLGIWPHGLLMSDHEDLCLALGCATSVAPQNLSRLRKEMGESDSQQWVPFFFSLFLAAVFWIMNCWVWVVLSAPHYVFIIIVIVIDGAMNPPWEYFFVIPGPHGQLRCSKLIPWKDPPKRWGALVFWEELAVFFAM